MKILVTGANGYLGQGIVKYLLNRGHTVIAADINTQYVDTRAICKTGNLFAVKDPYDFFEEPDCLLHLVWRDGFVHFSDAHFEDLPKHYLFLKRMLEAGLQQVAVMGSMHEVGFYEGCISETTPCRPQSFYGAAKNALRTATDILAKQNNAIFQWLRGYYIVGNSLFGDSIFSKISAAAAEGKTEFPFTMGQNQYDFLYYEEFCALVSAAIGQQEVTGIIEICSGRPEKLADRVERFISENGYAIKLNYGAFPDRPYDAKAVWGDARKIDRIMAAV